MIIKIFFVSYTNFWPQEKTFQTLIYTSLSLLKSSREKKKEDCDNYINMDRLQSANCVSRIKMLFLKSSETMEKLWICLQ